MPSIVWCDRAPYYVRQSKSEVANMAAGCQPHFLFIFLDLVDKYGEPLNTPEPAQVALKIDAISAIEDMP